MIATIMNHLKVYLDIALFGLKMDLVNHLHLEVAFKLFLKDIDNIVCQHLLVGDCFKILFGKISCRGLAKFANRFSVALTWSVYHFLSDWCESLRSFKTKIILQNKVFFYSINRKQFFMFLMAISAAAFHYSYFSPTLATFLFFLRTGILIILNLEFTFASLIINVNPFSFFVAEYSRSRVPCKVSFSSLNTSELSSVSKVMFFIFCNISRHFDRILDHDLLRLANLVVNFTFSVR